MTQSDAAGRPAHAQDLRLAARRRALVLNERQRVWIDRAPPWGLPIVDGLAFDAYRVAALPHATLDSAWFDVFVVADGRVAIAVGESAIRGAAQFFTRNLRELFVAGPSLPGAQALLSQYGDAASATALVGLVDLERQTFSYVSSGPAPLIRFSGGVIAQLPGSAQPAGTLAPGQIVADLRGAQCVLVATPGVVASAGGDAARLDRLGRALGDEQLPLDAFPTAWIGRRVAGDQSDGALLAFMPSAAASAAPPVLELPLPRWTVSWRFEATAAASNAARRAFSACLATTCSNRAPIDVGAAELIFGELLGNVVRHAPGPVEVELVWTDALPVLHVRDSGPGFRSRRRRERLPANDLSESGRGLFIISSLAATFSVRNRPGRGTHAMATLPPSPSG